MPWPDADVWRAARRRPLFDPAALPPCAAAPQDLLPHRGPMLLVRALTGAAPGEGRIAGAFAVAADEPSFAGHFPGQPVFPGVLLVEMIGQHALCLVRLASSARAGAPEVRLVRIHDAVFLRPVGPGDHLTVLAQHVDDGGMGFVALGQVLIGGEIAAVAAVEAFVEEVG
jgi:3-hydroxyacyl-[acyl-carrier-protein] dehydratase